MKLLIQISSIIVALLFIYSINFKSIITINYFANQAEITELFCINKEKPKLECNGKCHLMQEMNKVDDNKEDVPFSSSNLAYNLEINLSFSETGFDFSAPVNPKKETKYLITQELISEGFFSILSPPPRV